MTKEKWFDLAQESFRMVNNVWFIRKVNIENWTEYKADLLDCIKEVDEATEVFNMENK